MSKIQDYQDKLQQFEELKKVTSLGLTQVIFEQGGAVNQFIVDGANALAVSAIVSSVKRKPDFWLKEIFEEASINLLVAKKEAQIENENLIVSLQLTQDEIGKVDVAIAETAKLEAEALATASIGIEV